MPQIVKSKILSIVPVGKKKTFDITTRKNHNFIANGLVVHNCYQEQIMKIVQAVGGFNAEESNQIRRLLSKYREWENFGDPKRMKEIADWKEKFVGYAIKEIGKEEAERIYKEMAAFANYGFNKTCHFEELINIYDQNGRFLQQKMLKDVNPGDFVMSRDECSKQTVFVEVIEKHDHGIQKLVEISLDNGAKIRCSMNHKFRTTEGKMLPLWEILKNNYEIATI